nr:hypothetical protein Iba_chr02eCG6880 [Ipomoea batatas]
MPLSITEFDSAHRRDHHATRGAAGHDRDCHPDAATERKLARTWQQAARRMTTAEKLQRRGRAAAARQSSGDERAPAWTTATSSPDPCRRVSWDSQPATALIARQQQSSPVVGISVELPATSGESSNLLFPRQCSSGVRRWRGWRKLPVDALFLLLDQTATRWAAAACLQRAPAKRSDGGARWRTAAKALLLPLRSTQDGCFQIGWWQKDDKMCVEEKDNSSCVLLHYVLEGLNMVIQAMKM